MSLKLDIMDAHLDIFNDNTGSYSEEHDERFHQNISKLECPYQGRCNENMMGDFIQNLIRESDI